MPMMRVPLGRHGGDVALLEDDHAPGVLQDGRHVAGQEPLAVPEPDDQRHVHAGADDPVGMVEVHDADGVRAAHLVAARRRTASTRSPL